MKSKIIILLIVLRSGIGVYAQDCPGAPLTLSTQAQVDNFPNNFPGCTEVGVSITISGNNITNLNGLSQLESITKSLFIINNPSLTSLSGLSNLSNIGVELTIDNCDALVTLNGLQALPFIGGTLTITGNAVLNDLNALSGIGHINGSLLISQNPALASLAGLDNVAFTGRFLQISNNNALTALNSLDNLTAVGNNPNVIGRFLSIGSNPNLTTLNGLNSLVSVGTDFEIANNGNLMSLNAFVNLTTVGGEFSITNNPDLTSITDFDNLASVGGTLTISNNNVLSDCAAEGICNIVAPPGQQAVISNNDPGCNNENQVEAACAAAPVELTFFKGKYEDEAAVLTWQTATEKNNDYFIVEHSINGNHFQKLDKVAGHGTSSDVNNYQFRHVQPSNGAHYYRLKQVDFDGTSEYSNIAVVFAAGDDAVNIAPNPFADVVFIQGITDECVVRVRSASGMVILEKNISTNCPLDLSSAPNGIYFVEIQTDSQRTVKRMIKE
ncbi:MAG: hypothetical protein EPGJADBJ_02197 [Saprospiraceae bacterium]|nr:hypothetical protein [Saprospiraceae bacterium]